MYTNSDFSVTKYTKHLKLKSVGNYVWVQQKISENHINFKVILSPFNKVCFISFNESPLKMMKNAFCFIVKALFVLKIFKFLSWRFGHVEITA